MIKVLLVDDHALFREGLKQILSEDSNIEVRGQAENALEAIDLFWKDEFDVVVLDISLPGRSGLDVLMQLKDVKPTTKFLILSMHDEEEYAIRAFKVGAAGYLKKNSGSKELIEAIYRIASGRKYISRYLAEELATDLGRRKSIFPHKELSNREYEVMCMIASGKTVKEIAGELSLSISTVSTNRARILEKMKMRTNAELTHYAIKENLVF